MKNRNRSLAIVSILLALSIVNFFTISSSTATIRTVDFLSIFAIGALSALLIRALVVSRQKE